MRVNVQQALTLLRAGEVVAVPTETVYGLAADAYNDEALRQVFAIKRRPITHPLIVHISSVAEVLNWATVFPAKAQVLAQAFWPGALTLVLPAHPSVSSILRGGEPTIALRVPNHALTLALLEQGLSLAAPSANTFGALSPSTAEHVEDGLGAHIPVLDGGHCQLGIESTIVNVAADDSWQLLRLGCVSVDDIIDKIGAPIALQTAPKAPGQHSHHYAPRTPVRLFENRSKLLAEAQGQDCAVLTIASPLLGVANETLARDPALAATQLYAALHRLDAMRKDCLLIEMPPATPIWMAIRDRLKRAGA